MEPKANEFKIEDEPSGAVSRKALSKRTRFEIFKRDHFRCLYCGATPTQKVLRVDHVKPVVEGGTNDTANLVTSCFDCNAGKGPVPLEERKLTAGFANEAEKEHAEQIREWLKIQRDINDAREEVANEFTTYWAERIGPMTQDMANRFSRLPKEWSAAKLIEAMEITARKLPPRADGEFDSSYALKQQKYFHGILRRWREESEEEDAPSPSPQTKWSARAERVGHHLRAWNIAAPKTARLDDVFREFTLAAWARRIQSSTLRTLRSGRAEPSKDVVGWFCARSLFRTRPASPSGSRTILPRTSPLICLVRSKRRKASRVLPFTSS